MYVAISLNADDGVIKRDFLDRDYCEYFQRFGCQLVYIPVAVKDVETYFGDMPLQGVILSGGNDLSSDFTGQEARDVRNPSIERDLIEKKILNAAIQKKLPVLGVCRGLQFINCFFGGSITQDLPGHVKTVHVANVCDPTAAQLFGSEEIEVNSYHHQGVRSGQISSHLKIMAISKDDDVVEALYHPEYPIVGVQWHPEREIPSKMENERMTRAFFNRTHYWKGNI